MQNQSGGDSVELDTVFFFPHLLAPWSLLVGFRDNLVSNMFNQTAYKMGEKKSACKRKTSFARMVD